jgi:hypothetical protein
MLNLKYNCMFDSNYRMHEQIKIIIIQCMKNKICIK